MAIFKRQFLILLLASLFLVQCTTSPEDESADSLSAADQETLEEDDTAETDSELVGDEEGINANDINPAPDLAQDQAPSITTAPEPNPTSSGESTRVIGLDFKGGEGGGTIFIRTTSPAVYTTRSNYQNQQFVIEVENAELPAKFKRPYNTKEFTGPIAGIQAYQNPGNSTARFVIQMRENVEPMVRQEGNVLRISAFGDGPALSTADSDSSDAESHGMLAKDIDGRILSSRNIDEYLLGQSKFYGRPISLQVKEADIRDVFNFIAEESGLNIILSDDVTGKVTLKLRKIPWDQALVVIMKSRQLGYSRQGNILRIAPLKALQTEADAARSVLESQSKLKPLRVKVFPVSYSKVEDLELQARDFLSERGRVKADKRTNALIVNDIEENLEKISRLISQLDTQTPQVLIEAKVVEAQKTFQRRIGIRWGFTGSPVNMGQNSQGGLVDLTARGQFVNSLQNLSGSGGGDMSLTLGGLDVLGDLSAQLSLFESEGEIKVVSSPRIVTLNGVKANIEQSTQLPVPKVTPTVAGMNPITTYEFKPVVLRLEVSPQITADGGIIMQVKVVREFAGQFLPDGSAPINSRSAETTILVGNGQTAVMGGIYQSDAAESEDGVPLLRKIPIIGSLFKDANKRDSKNELMIFLTPRILNKERAFRQAKGSAS